MPTENTKQLSTDICGENSLPPYLKALIWEPGFKIEIVRKWRLYDHIILIGTLLTIVGIGVLWQRPDLVDLFLIWADLMDSSQQPSETRVLTVNWVFLFPALCGIVFSAGKFFLSFRYCFQLNFTTGQAKVRLRGRQKPFKIADIKEIILVKSGGGGCGMSPSASSDSVGHHYIRQRIEAKLDNDKIIRITIIRYSYHLDTVKKHYNELWPFTLSLAELLKCPAIYKE